MSTRVLLICGATGKQGGAVIHHLLKSTSSASPSPPLEILALTRDTSSPSAQRLLAKFPTRIKLLQGDLDDPAAIFASAAKVTASPVWGVFSVQAAMGSKTELRQGKSLIDAAIEAGVTHFVYTSVDRGGDVNSGSNPTTIPHFMHKHQIEEYLVSRTTASGGIDGTGGGDAMSWTILRPVAFMENLSDNLFGRVFTTAWKSAVKEKSLQLVAVSDIGHFAAQAFLHAETVAYNRQAISLAGDELTFTEACEVFKAKTGKELASGGIGPTILTKGLMWGVKDFGEMLRWFYKVGYGADIEKLRVLNPDLMDLGTWLERESDWADKKGKN